MPPRSPTLFLETFAQVRRSISAVIDEAYGVLGMGATQAKLLRRIGERRQVSQAELARATKTDPALTGRALQALLDRGWVRRRRSRDDRRAFSLELTPAGEAQLRDVLAAREEIALRIRSCLSEEDLAAFERLARKLLDAFPERVGAGDAVGVESGGKAARAAGARGEPFARMARSPRASAGGRRFRRGTTE